MARAAQGKWFADALISYAQGYRSFEAVNIGTPGTAVPAMQPGQVLLANGMPVPASGAGTQYILLQPYAGRLAAEPVAPALVLARDAEVNDAYIVYAPSNAGAVNPLLAALNIIVRPGVLPQSIVTASMLDEEGRMIEEGPHEPEPAAA
jgi:hypothetical protein